MNEQLPRKPDDADPEDVLQQARSAVVTTLRGDPPEGTWLQLELTDGEPPELELTTSEGGRYRALPENFSLDLAAQLAGDLLPGARRTARGDRPSSSASLVADDRVPESPKRA